MVQLLALLTTCAAPLAFAQGPEPAAELQPTLSNGPFTVGDLVAYMVHVPAAADEAIAAPRDKADFGVWEVRDYQEERLPDGIRVSYLLAAFETGELDVPATEFELAKPSGESRKLKTAAAKVTVASVLQEGDEQPADIVGPLTLREEPLAIALRVLLLLVVLAAAAVLVWWLWRRRKKRVVEQALRPDPPHVAALKALEALKAARLPEEGKIKAYYSELSEILREYVSGRYHIRTLEETTRRVIRNMEALPIAAPHAQQVGDLLREADLVKFAKARPDVAACWGALESAETLVKETAPPTAAREAE